MLHQGLRGLGVCLALGHVLLVACRVRAVLGYTPLRHCAKEAQFVAVLEVVLLRAYCAGGLASGCRLAAREAVPPAARVTELLEVGEVLHHEPFLLGGYWPAAGLGHQEQDPLAVLRLARVVLLLVPRGVLLRNKVELAELAHERPRDDGQLRATRSWSPSTSVPGT